MKRFDKISAGILPYALAICLIMSLLCSAAILLAYYKNILYLRLHTNSTLRSNAYSGLQYALVKGYEIDSTKSTLLDLYGRGNDSIYIEKTFWGVYPKYIVKAFKARQSKQLIALGGVTSFPYSEAAIYLANLREPLSVVGDTYIRGNAFLPASGVKAGYIANIGYRNSQLVFGDVGESAQHLPEVQVPFLDEIPGFLMRYEDYHQKMATQKILVNSHSSKTIILGSPNYLTLQEDLSGNILVISQQQIDVDGYSKLNGIIICAPRVKIDRGFEGTIQVFASDTVVIEDNVKLNFPSAVVLRGVPQKGLIAVGENSKIHGLVCNLSGDIILRSRTEIMGTVYGTGNVQLSGKIYGQVICNTFKEENASGIYINHILNAEVNRQVLSNSFVFAPIFDNRPQEIVKWLD